MLSKRIIPCLDVRDGRLTKGIKFKGNIDIGDPMEIADFYYEEGADEIVFYDITASSEGRDIMIETVRRVAQKIFIPFSVGGGIRTVDDMRNVLLAGSEKVSVNSAAIRNPSIISKGAKAFGSQCIVVAMDIKRIIAGEPKNVFASDTSLAINDDSLWEVYTHGGRNATGIDALKWARRVSELGAGELLVTSMDADGQKDGYDLELMHEIGQTVTVPIIASGGAGTLEHLYDAARGGSDAVLAASIFHYGEYTVRQAKDYLSERGLPIRPVL
ncbi:MAG: imidazole glycerol phosphate synthase subunit HisF [SAR202 cluster bacterium]|nr:imidazole glycerol phosphate synthase subunit HisF [SAR202 cluster bacterium]